MYDEGTGKPLREFDRDEAPLIKRPKGTHPPCHYNRCKKGSPTAKVAFVHENWKAYSHYKECKAVGQFPDDAIVRRNAVIIQQVEDVGKELRQIKILLGARHG